MSKEINLDSAVCYCGTYREALSAAKTFVCTGAVDEHHSCFIWQMAVQKFADVFRTDYLAQITPLYDAIPEVVIGMITAAQDGMQQSIVKLLHENKEEYIKQAKEVTIWYNEKENRNVTQ